MKLFFPSFAAFTIALLAIAASAAENAPAISAEQWKEVAKTHYNSPCAKNHSISCVIGEFDAAVAASGQPLSFVIDKNTGHFTIAPDLAEAVINHGVGDVALRLAGRLPDDQQRIKMNLLFTAGKYEEAGKLLQDMQGINWRNDFDAIWALWRKGDWNKALEIAKWVGDFRPEEKKPEAGASTSTRVVTGDCTNDIKYYPGAVAGLVHDFVAKKDYKKAEVALESLRNPLEQKASGCFAKSVKWRYFDALKILAVGYAKAGQKEKAGKLLLELRDRIAKFGGGSYYHPNYDDLVVTMMEAGLKSEAAEVTKLDDFRNLVEYPASESRYFADFLARVEWHAEQHQGALGRVAALDKKASQLSTLFNLARWSADKNQKEAVLIAVNALKQLLGSNKTEQENAFDYLDYAGLVLWLKNTDEAEKWLSKALAYYATERKNDSEQSDLEEKLIAFRFKHGSNQSIVAAIKDAGITGTLKSSDPVYGIVRDFSGSKNWKGFDNFLVEQSRENMKHSGSARWHSLGVYSGDDMLPQKQYARYIALVEKLDTGPEGLLRSYGRFLMAGLRRGSDVPPKLFAETWNRYWDLCYSMDGMTVQEKTERCYAGLIPRVAVYED